jgi:hypothetical protein
MPRLPCRDINFFIAAKSIFSSPRYRFFLRRDINFFFIAISIFSPHHGDIRSALQPRPITAIFVWPYSRAPSQRYSFGLTAAPHHFDIHSALQPCPIMAIFIRPYSRAPSRRYSFGLTAALFTQLFLAARVQHPPRLPRCDFSDFGRAAVVGPQCPLGAQICLSGAPSAIMATHLSYGTPHASRHPNAFSVPKFALVVPHLPLWQHICLMAPHMPHGAPMPSRHPNLP